MGSREHRISGGKRGRRTKSRFRDREKESRLLFAESEEAAKGTQEATNYGAKRAEQSGKPAWEAWAEAARRPSRERLFSAPPPSPSRGRSCLGGQSSCFCRAGDRGGKGIPGAARQAGSGRQCEWETTPRRLPQSQRQTSPFPPFAFFIPQLPGRLVSASTDRARPPHPPPPFFSPPLTPPQHPKPGEGLTARAAPSPPGTPESQTPPATRHSHPFGGSLALPDAANSSHLH